MSLVLILLNLINISPSLAQPSAEDKKDARRSTKVNGVTDANDAAGFSRSLSFGDIDAASIPVDKKKARVESMLVDQRSTLGRVVTVLANARNSRDIVKLHCVNEKLIQIKGLLKISEQASLQMYEAIANDAQDLVNHEFTKVVVSHQKSQELRTEAEKCVGENAAYAGNTSVDIEIDDNADGFGTDAPGAVAPPPGPAVPPVASTF
ncbi:MAG: hypothetical protein KTR25_10365 [Myxococcales bacterium]|nr:hypothetical protein [Myxococcales bacterium]